MKTAFKESFEGIGSLKQKLRVSGAVLLIGILLTPAFWGTMVAADPTITLYDTPQNGYPYSLTQGADGNGWFTYMYGDTIGRITQNGTITNYTVPTSNSDPFGITTGPDGKVWFTERNAGKIANIDTSGSIAEVITLPSGHSPTAITTGSDGNLWFTDTSSSSSGTLYIGQLTPSGSSTEYTVGSGLSAYDITRGPDGALWFPINSYNSGYSGIGRISTAGTVTQYNLPNNSQGHGITTGSDGNLWFTEVGSNKIGRMTPTGTLTEYTIPTANSQPYFITNGPDGAVWFGEYNTDKLGRITTTGSISEYPVNKTSADISGMQTFSDGSLWFAGSNYIIGRATLPPAAPVVHVTDPAASSTVSGTVNITGTINSPANYSLMLYVFNASSQAVVSRYQYNVPVSTTTTSYSWDTTALPNGNYTIILSAKDINGHKDAGSTSTLHITVQN
jgi:streptogramin lyase